MNTRTLRLLAVLLLTVASTGCSVNRMIAYGTGRMLDGGIAAVYRETDLALARDALPSQLLLLETVLEQSPNDAKLRLYAAQAYYSYAFAFIEDEDRVRAGRHYERAFRHALVALPDEKLREHFVSLSADEFSKRVSRLGKSDVPAMFWTASALGKWVDVNRDDPAVLANGFRAVMLMDRVLALDPEYFFGGPYLFFGAFLASTPIALGGDPARAREYFDKARAATHGRLLIVDVLDAQLLARQTQDRKRFHERLTTVVKSDDDAWPDMALINAVARAKARRLLALEDEWF